MKKKISLLIIFIVALCIFSKGENMVYAQTDINKVVLTVEDNKKEVQVGETFKVSIKVEEAIDIFGLQLKLNYDPSMIQVAQDGINIEDNMSLFGGQVEDTKNGSLTYPFINKESNKDQVENLPVANLTFKALKKGPVIITLDHIKAVNTGVQEINYNTQYQTALNIKDELATPPKEDTEKPTKPGTQKPPNNKGDTTSPNDKPSQEGKKPASSDKSSQSNNTGKGGTNHSPGEDSGNKSEDRGSSATGPAHSASGNSSSGGSGSQDISLGDDEDEGDEENRENEENNVAKENDDEDQDEESVHENEDDNQDKESANKNEDHTNSQTAIIIILLIALLAAVGYIIYSKNKGEK